MTDIRDVEGLAGAEVKAFLSFDWPLSAGEAQLVARLMANERLWQAIKAQLEAAEREACAVVADETAIEWDAYWEDYFHHGGDSRHWADSTRADAARSIAAVIRARVNITATSDNRGCGT